MFEEESYYGAGYALIAELIEYIHSTQLAGGFVNRHEAADAGTRAIDLGDSDEVLMMRRHEVDLSVAIISPGQFRFQKCSNGYQCCDLHDA